MEYLLLQYKNLATYWLTRQDLSGKLRTLVHKSMVAILSNGVLA